MITFTGTFLFLPGLDAMSVVLLALLRLFVILGELGCKSQFSGVAAPSSSSSSIPVSWSWHDYPGMVAVDPSTAVFWKSSTI